MILRPFFFSPTSCASYLFGCTTQGHLAVVDPHADLVESYLEAAGEVGAPIVAVLETHVQADHVSGLPALVERTGATAYLPAGSGVEFDHVPLADGDVVELGNTQARALATPGHAPAQTRTSSPISAVARSIRGSCSPATRFSSATSAGRISTRPATRPLARELHASLRRLLELPDEVVVYPSHYGGSVCGRGLSGNPVSSIGFERRHNRALRHDDVESFVRDVLRDVPPPPAHQAEIVAANRAGRTQTPA